MGFGERLNELLKKKNITHEELAEKLGVTRAAVSNWARGIRFPKDEKIIRKIAKILEVPEQDLFDPTKKEQIVKSELQKNYKKYIHEIPEIQLLQDMIRFRFAPVGAGAEALADESMLENIYIPKELLPEDFEKKYKIEDIYVMKVYGDSMEPKFSEGDILFFEMFRYGTPEILPDGIYLVRYGQTVQVKSVQFLGNGDIRIISFNETYPPIQPVKDLGVDWEILGKPILHFHIQTFSDK